MKLRPLPVMVQMISFHYLLQADEGNNSIRKITPNGEVSSLAGSKDGFAGDIDGTEVNARFSNPLGIAVDVERNIYVADIGNSKIRKITQE